MKLLHRFVALIGVILILSFLSCTDEDGTGTVEIKIKLQYENQALVTLQEYNYPMGFQVFFTKYSVFLSELQLINSENTVSLADVVFLNITENQMDQNSAEEGSVIRISNVPAGEYGQFHINLGVPESLNAMSPSDFEVGHPLANTGEYWEGWASYIFHKTEGRMDLDDDGEFETAIALHIGSDAAFREKYLNKSIQVKSDETTEIEFVIDVKNVFMIQNTPFDLENTPQIHHLGQLPLALPLMDNIIDSFQ